MKTKLIIIISSVVLVALVGTIIPVVLLTTGEKDPPILDPLVQITPRQGALVSGTVEIEFRAIDKGDDASGIKAHNIYINDELVSETNSYSWDTTPYEDGYDAEIKLEAIDNNRNKAEWFRNVRVDNTFESPRSDVLKVMVHNLYVSGTIIENWKDVLFEENADILLLSETGLLDDTGVMERLANDLNYYFYYEAPYSGDATDALAYTDGVAVMSRYPILEFHDIPAYRLDDGSTHDYHRAFCDAVVDIHGKTTHVITYHGKCCTGTISNNSLIRETEMQGIINYMDDIGDVPIFFGGDFNANSPFDVGDVAGVADNLGTGPIRMLLIPDDPYYENYTSQVHNFTDTWRTMYPHTKGWTYGFTDPQYWGRIDFLFVNHHWADKMINGTTGDTPSANFTSDHYSVDAFFSLDPEYSYNDTLYSKTSTQSIKIKITVKTSIVKNDQLQRLVQTRIAIVSCYKKAN